MAMNTILTGQVMHARTIPKRNAFRYGIYYLALPLDTLNAKRGPFFGINHPGVLSFHNRDHGNRDGTDLRLWAGRILRDAGFDDTGWGITLICMPRVFGHVFNPVSFWLCHDAQQTLRAVLCEVNNTFGERHTYLCTPQDADAITHQTWLEARKLFHVSPFLEREGHYRFRFASLPESFGVWIDYYNAAGDRQLLTALTGKLAPLTPASLWQAFWRYPAVSFMALVRIHWQAVRLLARGIRYVPKPAQHAEKLSRTTTLTEM